MQKFIKNISKNLGQVPGTLVYIGDKKAEKVKITVIDYDENNFQEKVFERIEDTFPFKDTPTVTWINIDGVHNTENIQKIGDYFQMHPLALEDIANTGQRPKLEDFEKYLFGVLKMLYRDEKEDRMIIEQVSLMVGPNYVITFQEREGDVFEPVRKRIRQGKGKIRKMGADYLAYALVDAVVDNYFVVLENFSERLEGMEETLATNPSVEDLQLIYSLKREAILMRKSVWPLREVVNSFSRSESELINKNTEIYFRDVYDHAVQVIDTIEAFRDMVSGMLDIYLSSVSNKMNEVMKVLTIFAAIFIPLTFVAGIYGMNFENMPELKWPWGYFMILGVMALVGFVMLAFFRRKKWL